MKRELIFIRHGQSLFNAQNLFTGWSDIELSEQGISEAKNAGKILLSHGMYPDICFTSWLKRSIHTTQLILHEMDWEHIDNKRTWKLNERHYGAWQKRDKQEVKKEVGNKLFFDVRRGYHTAPPPLGVEDKKLLLNSAKYKNIDKDLLPSSESLEDTKNRVLPYFFEKIIPQLAEGKRVLVSAHGNSIRALVMYLENIDIKNVSDLEIQTGVPIVYNLDENMKIINKEVLA